MDRSRTVTCVILSFMALAFVALALIVNWSKARTKTIDVDRGREDHRHARPAAYV